VSVSLFQSEEFLDQLVRKPTESHDVLHLSMRELLYTLQDEELTRLNLNEGDTALTFENLMTILLFCRKYQLKVHDHGQSDANIKEAEIKNVINFLLELLKSVL
jgi:hypothetical protein